MPSHRKTTAGTANRAIQAHTTVARKIEARGRLPSSTTQTRCSETLLLPQPAISHSRCNSHSIGARVIDHRVSSSPPSLVGFSGFRPVIPQTSRSISFESISRSSTQLNDLRKVGRLEIWAPGNSAGITGQFRSVNSSRRALISRSCHFPKPLGPIRTTAAPMFSICSSTSSCQDRPGGKSSSSIHSRSLYSRRRSLIKRAHTLSAWL